MCVPTIMVSESSLAELTQTVHCAVLCPSDWFQWEGHCYKAEQEKASHDVLKQGCKDVNTMADLSSVLSDRENGELASHEKTPSFIGLRRGRYTVLGVRRLGGPAVGEMYFTSCWQGGVELGRQ